MRSLSKKNMKEWMFMASAFALFCVMALYVFLSLRYLVRVSDEAVAPRTSSGNLIERFDFATLEQALQGKAGLLPESL